MAPGVPRCVQGSSSCAQVCPGQFQDAPRSAQVYPGCPQVCPGQFQDAPRSAQVSPGCPQLPPGVSRMPPGVPRMPPGVPRMPPGVPRCPQSRKPRSSSRSRSLSQGSTSKTLTWKSRAKEGRRGRSQVETTPQLTTPTWGQGNTHPGSPGVRDHAPTDHAHLRTGKHPPGVTWGQGPRPS
ncbi:basic salivary proline-rich protein 2-like [Haemorhous mexicanus]|uniref:basic salivary proline-rich protein 2-like n=1 Tax=Haemorhous mexicanus TaxID=30427 RepID=UPI0028BE0D7B|nr:basic salivary proline-rich protein 2-like [Haemorhous mexicanus]